MTTQQAITILKQYRAWRRDKNAPHTEVSEAIDTVIRVLEIETIDDI